MSSILDLKAVFRDTEAICQNEADIKALTGKMVQDTVLYCDYDYQLSAVHTQKEGRITVVPLSSFQAACQYSSMGKTAVLNFANPVEPGGGVKRGARAQEETLCRCSNLYFSLIRPDIIEQYYGFHQQQGGYVFSDRIIYSPDVLVIKSDDESPTRLEFPYSVNVITCAAPYNGDEWISDTDTIFYSRIKAILEVATKNQIENLILGAWGCGAFCNPPQLVADQFNRVLTLERYRYAFDNIVFAIIKSAQNFDVFEKYLLP